jgi:serine/threonine protein phosphatase PrpC
MKIITKTDIGAKREHNEDFVVAITLDLKCEALSTSLAVLVLADGMGGYGHGEIASKIAAKTFIKTLFDKDFVGEDIGSNYWEDILKSAVEKANQEVLDLSISKQMGKIGTTLLGAIVSNGRAFIVSVGDSRAYLIKPRKFIKQLTKDHTASQEMLEAGIITREQFKNHPRRNVLTRTVGLENFVNTDFFDIKIENEILLLCSDGLYNYVNDSDILLLINKNLKKSADSLIECANSRGGEDNISLIMVSNE